MLGKERMITRASQRPERGVTKSQLTLPSRPFSLSAGIFLRGMLYARSGQWIIHK